MAKFGPRLSRINLGGHYAAWGIDHRGANGWGRPDGFEADALQG